MVGKFICITNIIYTSKCVKRFGICKLQLTNCIYCENKIRKLCNYKDYLCNYKLFGFVKLASGLPYLENRCRILLVLACSISITIEELYIVK